MEPNGQQALRDIVVGCRGTRKLDHYGSRFRLCFVHVIVCDLSSRKSRGAFLEIGETNLSVTPASDNQRMKNPPAGLVGRHRPCDGCARSEHESQCLGVGIIGRGALSDDLHRLSIGTEKAGGDGVAHQVIGAAADITDSRSVSMRHTHERSGTRRAAHGDRFVAESLSAAYRHRRGGIRSGGRYP